MENSGASSSDIISNILDNLMESILTLLPIRDAARTSVLSRCWRHKWRNMPDLVFDDAFLNSMRQQPLEIVIGTIYQIVSAHRRPIIKFTLSIPGLISSPEINSLMHRLLANGVQEFTLHNCGFQDHTLPLGLYLHAQLTHLNLHCCHFDPPPTFSGFPSLICLVLCEVRITSVVIVSLISSCPLLEKLTLERCDDVDCLKIVAPNLKSFFFKGFLLSVDVIDSPCLEMVSIDVGLPPDILYPMEGTAFKLTGLLGSLAVVENLCLDYYYVQHLAAHNLRTAFIRLQVLKLSGISFEQSEFTGTLTLIRNCPNLRKLIIDIYSGGHAMGVSVAQFYEETGSWGFSFNKMKEMEIVSLAGCKVEMAFIKFVMAKSPILEKMTLVLESSCVRNRVMRILIELSQSCKLSPNAEIIVKDPTGVAGRWM